MTPPPPPLTRDVEASLAWWAMAGVDCDYADDATDWLAEPPSTEPENAPAKGDRDTRKGPAAKHGARGDLQENQAPRRDLLGEDAPRSLDAFARWWLEAPGLDAIGPRGRVAPRGPANPPLMVLVEQPEERDRDRLLSGPQGRLLDNMLRAMGIAPGDAYIAAALPRHTPVADIAAIAAGGLDAVTAHHVGLVSPQRLLTLGPGLLPMLGLDAKDREKARIGELTWRSTPLLVAEGLDTMMAMPRAKARVWRRWLQWESGS